MSKLTDLIVLARGWKNQEGGESGLIGGWILDILDSAEYDKMSGGEKLALVKSSMEEIQNVAKYVIGTLEE